MFTSLTIVFMFRTCGAVGKHHACGSWAPCVRKLHIIWNDIGMEVTYN